MPTEIHRIQKLNELLLVDFRTTENYSQLLSQCHENPKGFIESKGERFFNYNAAYKILSFLLLNMFYFSFFSWPATNPKGGRGKVGER